MGTVTSPHDLGPQICAAIGIDSGLVRRVIVDVNVGAAVAVYVEMYADEKVLTIDWAKGLQGAQIERERIDG